MTKAFRIPPFILALFCLDAILVAVYLIDAQLGSPLGKYTHQHDLNAEGNFPTWLSSAKYLLAAGLLWFSVVGRIRKGEPRTWWLAFFPVMLLAMSCDETAQIHEALGRKADQAVLHGSRAASHFANTGVWTLIIGIPIVLLLVGGLFAMGRATFWKTSALWRFVLGLAIMLTGALGLETLSNFLPHSGGVYEIAFEEYFEMLGATIMLWAARDQAMADLKEMVDVNSGNRSIPIESGRSTKRSA